MFCSLEDDASVAKSRVRMSVVGGDEPRSRLVKVAPGRWGWEACGGRVGLCHRSTGNSEAPELEVV